MGRRVVMNNKLQHDYQDLLKKLEEAKTFLIRAETTLEQKQVEVNNAKAELKQLTTLDDPTQINVLLQDIDQELEKLLAEAQALYQDAYDLN